MSNPVLSLEEGIALGTHEMLEEIQREIAASTNPETTVALQRLELIAQIKLKHAPTNPLG
jgi:hypothetical protein